MFIFAPSFVEKKMNMVKRKVIPSAILQPFERSVLASAFPVPRPAPFRPCAPRRRRRHSCPLIRRRRVIRCLADRDLGDQDGVLVHVSGALFAFGASGIQPHPLLSGKHILICYEIRGRNFSSIFFGAKRCLDFGTCQLRALHKPDLPSIHW